MAIHADLDFEAFLDELDTVLIATDQTCGKVFHDLTEKVLLMMSSAFCEFTHREMINLSRHLTNKGAIRIGARTRTNCAGISTSRMMTSSAMRRK